jgi:anti-sigma28 factor (negative regulator of flagellin synthesis)
MANEMEELMNGRIEKLTNEIENGKWKMVSPKVLHFQLLLFVHTLIY